MSGDDTRRRLEEAGSTPVPELDPAFARRLDGRLRAVAASGAAATAQPTPRRRRSTWPVAAIAAGLVAVILVGLAVLPPGRVAPLPSSPALELTATVNVVVQLADGTVVDNPDGLLLPEGAIVTVGDGGSASIGGTELGPGERVVIQAGAIVVQQEAVSSGHASGSTGASQAPTSIPTATGGRPTAAAPSATPTPTPVRSAPPTPTLPTATPSDATTSTPSPTTAPTPSPTPIPRPRLAASLLDPATISVDWTRTPGAKQYVLVITRSKTGTAPRPQYPGSKLQLVFAHPPLNPLHLKVPLGVLQVKLMVVALDANGVELARSRIARIDVPPLVNIGSPSPSASPATDASPTPTPTPTPS
jgi:hypothetical protein